MIDKPRAVDGDTVTTFADNFLVAHFYETNFAENCQIVLCQMVRLTGLFKTYATYIGSDCHLKLGQIKLSKLSNNNFSMDCYQMVRQLVVFIPDLVTKFTFIFVIRDIENIEAEEEHLAVVVDIVSQLLLSPRLL